MTAVQIVVIVAAVAAVWANVDRALWILSRPQWAPRRHALSGHVAAAACALVVLGVALVT